MVCDTMKFSVATSAINVVCSSIGRTNESMETDYGCEDEIPAPIRLMWPTIRPENSIASLVFSMSVENFSLEVKYGKTSQLFFVEPPGPSSSSLFSLFSYFFILCTFFLTYCYLLFT